MGRFVESTLWCIAYFLILVIFLGSFIYGLLNNLIESATSEGTIRNILQTLVQTVVCCLLLYIIMFRSGHKGNITAFTGKTTLKDMIIPITISVLLFQILLLLNRIDFIMTLPQEHYLYIDRNKQEVFISLLPRFLLQSILYLISMILGYRNGYKKFDKERLEMLSNKMEMN